MTLTQIWLALKVNFANILTALLFSLILTGYFTSSEGLINSADSPQYFTTLALLKNGLFTPEALDIAPFASDPHYFAWPDYYVKDNQILNVRGYLVSIVTMPFHLLASSYSFLVKIDNFAPEVVTPNFPIELLVTSLFTLFSVIGLLFVWKAVKEATQQPHLANLVVAILAFGTYIWKYSYLYARHGVTVFILGVQVYCLQKVFLQKAKIHWLVLLMVMTAISFGVDILLFGATLISLLVTGIFLLAQNKPKQVALFISGINSRKNIVLLLLGIVIFIANILGNVYWYNSLTFSQTHQVVWFHEVFPELSQQESLKIWFSTPVFPAVKQVLFGQGPVPESALTNFTNLPAKIAETLSVTYVQRYTFYGLFAITPVLIWSVLSLFQSDQRRQKISRLMWFMFAVGIILNAKTLGFWGGNQYDVRYFYPYTILLALPLAFTIQLIQKLSNRWLKLIAVGVLIYTVSISLIMGWFGNMAMYKPALTGERKIFMNEVSVKELFSIYTSQEIVAATFVNRANWQIPVIISLLGSALFLFKVSKKSKQQQLIS